MSTATNEKLLDETNELLACVGISAKRISSLTELSRVASSMFVAVYETLFRVHLDDVNRNPRTKEEYAANSQKVINELSMQIDINLKHISGQDIANGDLRSISNLLKIFAQIWRTTSSAGSTVGQGGSASLSVCIIVITYFVNVNKYMYVYACSSHL